MLSERERRVLREIEQHIAAGDPRLAEFMTRVGPSCWVRRCYDAVIVVALVLAAACMALSEAGAGYGGVMATSFAALTCFIRCWRFPPHWPQLPR